MISLNSIFVATKGRRNGARVHFQRIGMIREGHLWILANMLSRAAAQARVCPFVHQCTAAIACVDAHRPFLSVALVTLF